MTTAQAESLKVKPARPGSLVEVVRWSYDAPVANAAVELSPVDTSTGIPSRFNTTNDSGRVRFDSLEAARYQLRVAPAGTKSAVFQLDVSNAVSGSLVVPAPEGRPSTPEVVWTVIALVTYLVIIVLARWHHIARSVHAMVDRQLGALETRLTVEVHDPQDRRIAYLQTVVAGLREAQNERTGSIEWRPTVGRFFRTFPGFFFWSRGDENATWMAIHEVERQLAAFLSPPAHVEVYLRWACAELQTINKPVATAIADAIRVALAVPVPTEPTVRAEREESRKALLGRAVATIYDDRDTSFSTLMEWQNKANWLILAALLLIGLLAAVLGHAVLFLAGATGGYVSRLMRALKREDVPLDYGASWTTLFLSPLFGAIVGWFGLALIALAADPRVKLLGSAFELVSWYRPYEVPALAVAFLLGFSERLFDSVVAALEQHAVRPDTPQVSPPSLASLTPQLVSPQPVTPLAPQPPPGPAPAPGGGTPAGSPASPPPATPPPGQGPVDLGAGGGAPAGTPPGPPEPPSEHPALPGTLGPPPGPLPS